MTKDELQFLVDRYAYIRAEQQELEEERKDILEQLTSLEPGRYAGDISVISVTEQVRLDSKKVADVFGGSAKFEAMCDMKPNSKKVRKLLPDDEYRALCTSSRVVKVLNND